MDRHWLPLVSTGLPDSHLKVPKLCGCWDTYFALLLSPKKFGCQTTNIFKPPLICLERLMQSRAGSLRCHHIPPNSFPFVLPRETKVIPSFLPSRPQSLLPHSVGDQASPSSLPLELQFSYTSPLPLPLPNLLPFPLPLPPPASKLPKTLSPTKNLIVFLYSAPPTSLGSQRVSLAHIRHPMSLSYSR